MKIPIELMGTCYSCGVAKCNCPLIKKFRPENGCMSWEKIDEDKFTLDNINKGGEYEQ